MNDMFGFGMVGNYEERKVANNKVKDAEIDTAAVTDSAHPFETAVKHPRFYDGKWIVVEMYDTKEASQAGHDKWVKVFNKKKLPASLRDVSTCSVAKMVDDISKDKKWRDKSKEEL